MDKMCHTCSKTYATAYSFRRHMLEQHGEIVKSAWTKKKCDVTALRHAKPAIAPVAPEVTPHITQRVRNMAQNGTCVIPKVRNVTPNVTHVMPNVTHVTPM